MKLRMTHGGLAFCLLAVVALGGCADEGRSGDVMNDGDTSDVTADTTPDANPDTTPDTTNPVCGDGTVDTGEDCDDMGESATCNDDCTTATCGDAVLNATAGEACDDGNMVDDDMCTNACALPVCGDGIVQMGEGCDDGNMDDTDACTNGCMLPTCGDAIVQMGEDCDDGNMDDTDACLSTCVTAACGDGYAQAGVEDCDGDGMGMGGETATCNDDCTASTCGDTVLNLTAGETCDDGNTVLLDGCNDMCQLECGDSVQGPLEVCDDGNTVDGDGCSADCQSDETCGNTIADTAAGEQCDDGNFMDGDGCSADCLSDETCANGVTDAVTGETCDDGNTTNDDGCSDMCQLECGNGTLNTGEDCDDAGDSMTCNADCSFAVCGDGYLNTAAGEACDDGDMDDTNACNNMCQSNMNVLLMGDDTDDPAEWDVYRAALTAAGVTVYTEINLDTLAFPDANALAMFDTIVFFDEGTLQWGDAEAQLLVDWLNLGGRSLFVTNIDLIWDLENGAVSSGENNLYLATGVPYLGDYAGTNNTTIDGVPGDPIGGSFAPPNGLILGTSGVNGDYASPTLGPATNSGVYVGMGAGAGSSALMRYDTGTYKVVWLGVNFHEALTDATQRGQLMTNIITWFAL